MKIVHEPDGLAGEASKFCLSIGVFDGVHLGHQQVIRNSIDDARQVNALAVVVTFDRHPNAVVAPERTPALIYPLGQRLRVLAALGAEAALVIPFDEAFSRQSAEAFIHRLAQGFGHIKSLTVGSAFTFGYRRSGNIHLLRSLGKELGFALHAMAAISLDGKPVSSTRIRESIARGQLIAASQMLGRPYSLTGPVIAGDRLGQEFGFPTANLDTTGLALPPDGVYAAHALIEGQSHPAAVNIGLRPTLKQPAAARRVEAHLLGFSGDLYGRELELVFRGKLRDEQNFNSLEELKGQIRADVARTRDFFGLEPS